MIYPQESLLLSLLGEVISTLSPLYTDLISSTIVVISVTVSANITRDEGRCTIGFLGTQSILQIYPYFRHEEGFFMCPKAILLFPYILIGLIKKKNNQPLALTINPQSYTNSTIITYWCKTQKFVNCCLWFLNFISRHVITTIKMFSTALITKIIS